MNIKYSYNYQYCYKYKYQFEAVMLCTKTNLFSEIIGTIGLLILF